ncbi:MAG: DinB family protein [Blastocatellia bacterium]
MAHETLIADNLDILQQGLRLLARIDDRQFTATDAALYGYGVGSHIRHCLDAYDNFLAGLVTGQIDYDHRRPDPGLEQNRGRAITRMAAVMEQLDAIRALPALLQSRLDSPIWTTTSPQRELQFLVSHTVHHYALIALMLRTQGYTPPAEFGVAPSTLKRWKENAVCAR